MIITQPCDMSLLKRPRFICEKQQISDFIKLVKLKVSHMPFNLSNPTFLSFKSILKLPINIMFSYVCVYVFVCVSLCVFISFHRKVFCSLNKTIIAMPGFRSAMLC